VIKMCWQKRSVKNGAKLRNVWEVYCHEGV
jgi:hypothetical protein